MSDTNQPLEEALFDRASQKPVGAEREAFLDGVCRDRPDLRARLDLLLEGYDGVSGFLTRLPDRGASWNVAAPLSQDPAGRTVGRYKLLERLGEGGFGEVWMAEQREPVRRRVAVKLIKPGMDCRQVVARFEAERQALALMDHPNIARVLDAGETENGRPYFVMELVRGFRITDFCDQAQLSTRDRLGLFIQVCHAVQHAHQKGIIHRDIKPSNVMVTLHDGVPVPKVIDFGIAKATQGDLTDKTVFTQFQQFIGTPAYVSPEQAEMSSLDIDTRSDIYSLGILLYELLVGRTPFEASEMLQGGLGALRRIIVEVEPPRPSTRLSTLNGAELANAGKRRKTEAGALAYEIRGDLDWIVMKCLEKDRNRRYETASALAADIRRHLEQEEVLARPPSTAYRLRKAWQRNRVLVSTIFAVALVLILATSVSTWQAIRATKARRAEAEQRRLAMEKRGEAESERRRAESSEERTATLLYAANMNLVQSNFEQSNVPVALWLLGLTRNHHDRGFEWYYWQNQLHRETRILRGHAGAIQRVAFSPDGRLLLTGGEDSVVLLRDLAGGGEKLRLQGVDFEQFSPDGERLLCRSRKTGLQVNSVAAGKKTVQLGPGVGGTFSPDGTVVAAARGERVVLWDSLTGREISSFKAFSPFARHVLRPISFSPDGTSILVADNSLFGKAFVHEWRTGKRKVELNFPGNALMGAFTPDAQRIAIWSRYGGDPLIWEMERPDRPLGRLEGAGNAAVRFSSDGRRILTGGREHRAVLWDALTLQKLGQYQGHTDEIEDVALSPDGHWVATAGRDGTARVWALGDFVGPRRLPGPGNSSETFAADFSRDGRLMATAGKGFAAIWETATGRLVHQLKVYQEISGKVRQLQEDHVESVSFSPDGKRLVAAGNDSVAIVFDVVSGSPISTLDHSSTNLADRRIRSAVFSPDGKRIVTMNHLKVKTWDAESGRLLRTRTHTKTNGLHTVPPVGFTPDGRRLYCASIQEVTIWDESTGEESFNMPLEDAAMMNAMHPTIAFSPDGRRFALSCQKWNGAIRIYDATEGRQLDVLLGHRERVMSLEFSPDGTRLLSGSMDGSARLWNLRSGREVLSLKGPNVIQCARFSPEGQRIFAGGWFDHGLLWEASTPDQLAAWESQGAEEVRQWNAMNEEFAKRRAAAWAADEAAKRARRAAIEKATSEGLTRLGDPGRIGSTPGAIRQWLVLLPPEGSFFGEIQLDEEQIPGEARMRPRAGEIMRIDTEERVWIPIRLEGYRLDFHRAVEAGERSTVAYAVSYILSDRDQSDLHMKTGSDYHAKILLNGREVYRRTHPSSVEPDRDTVTGLELKAGLNVLVFKVVKAGIYDDTLGWSGSVRFTNADGSPASGLKVTLDPDALK